MSIGKKAQEDLENLVKEDNSATPASFSDNRGSSDYSNSVNNPYGNPSLSPTSDANGSNWVNGTSSGATGSPPSVSGSSGFGSITGAKPKNKDMK